MTNRVMWEISKARLTRTADRLPAQKYGSPKPHILYDPYEYKVYLRQPATRPELPSRTELRHMLMGYRCDRWEIWQVMKHYKVTWCELTQVIPEADLEKYST